jgi:hypothetical protein
MRTFIGLPFTWLPNRVRPTRSGACSLVPTIFELATCFKPYLAQNSPSTLLKALPPSSFILKPFSLYINRPYAPLLRQIENKAYIALVAREEDKAYINIYNQVHFL